MCALLHEQNCHSQAQSLAAACNVDVLSKGMSVYTSDAGVDAPFRRGTSSCDQTWRYRFKGCPEPPPPAAMRKTVLFDLHILPYNAARLPNNIWLEIILACTPRELLAIQRSSRRFRAILATNPRSWVQARNNLDPPVPPPPFVAAAGVWTEAAYAQFIFGGGHCVVKSCKAFTNNFPLSFGLRIRVCSDNCKHVLSRNYDKANAKVKNAYLTSVSIPGRRGLRQQGQTHRLHFRDWLVYDERRLTKYKTYRVTTLAEADQEWWAARAVTEKRVKNPPVKVRRSVIELKEQYKLRAQALPRIIQNAEALQVWVTEYEISRRAAELANVKFMQTVVSPRESLPYRKLIATPTVQRMFKLYGDSLGRIDVRAWCSVRLDALKDYCLAQEQKRLIPKRVNSKIATEPHSSPALTSASARTFLTTTYPPVYASSAGSRSKERDRVRGPPSEDRIVSALALLSLAAPPFCLRGLLRNNCGEFDPALRVPIASKDSTTALRPSTSVMAGILSYFGAGRDTTQATRDAIIAIRQHLNLLEKKDASLQKQIAEQLNKAKSLVVSNKPAATSALKKKHLLETQLEQLGGQQLQLEMQLNTLEGASFNAESLAALKKSAEVLKQIHRSATVDSMDRTMGEIEEQREIAKEIAGLISAPTGPELASEEEFAQELAELEDELLTDAFSRALHVPTENPPGAAVARGGEVEDPEDAIIQRMQAEMAM
ncbi:Dienelactone hydrolase endo-1,3,1,4-beta-D-glucanase [Mycena kentingensis (nom. inval.)]|nr:Dienelactone hydrolase endo-1,3,1,4-beta-D-glucanase [Mycena kentingensis (nom. inval.)]